MVPQPKSEVERQVYALLYPQLVWGLSGKVDKAMYSAGKSGRNRFVELEEA
jgi:hypothetical protein